MLFLTYMLKSQVEQVEHTHAVHCARMYRQHIPPKRVTMKKMQPWLSQWIWPSITHTKIEIDLVIKKRKIFGWHNEWKRQHRQHLKHNQGKEKKTCKQTTWLSEKVLNLLFLYPPLVYHQIILKMKNGISLKCVINRCSQRPS